MNDDRVLVTVGRAAQMLRMDRRNVRLYAHAGELVGAQVEGAYLAHGVRAIQLVFTKGEVRRFRQALENRQRRRPTRAAQLDLPLRTAGRPRPQSWRWAAFKPSWRPRMLKAEGVERSRSGSWPSENAARSGRAS